jgi:hypothetical protein
MQFWLMSGCTTNFHGILTFKENTAYEKMAMAGVNRVRAQCISKQ